VPIPEGSVLAVQTKWEGKEYLESTSDAWVGRHDIAAGIDHGRRLPLSVGDGRIAVSHTDRAGLGLASRGGRIAGRWWILEKEEEAL
jgi:hypothetical protein